MSDPDSTKRTWERSKDLFRRAIALPPAERKQFLRQQCTDDDDLLANVSRLLAEAEQTDTGLRDLVARAADDASEQISTDLAGARIGPYAIVRRIGEGGMGDVFLAERADDQYRRQVAIKILRPGRDDKALVKRFRAERQILADLDHPNIARLIDGGETVEGRPYLVMEYIDGTPITEYCDDNALGTRARLRIFLQCCAAVAHAHRRLVVHRDLKPTNILVDASGTPKLLDFGIAKLLDSSRMQHTMAITQESARLMTPGHASPEQISGDVITTATDIYSLGVLLYQLLSGRFPYTVTSYASSELEKAILTTPPQKPSSRVSEADDTSPVSASDIGRSRSTSAGRLKKELAGDLDNIVLVALRKEADRRYSTAGEMAADINNYLDYRPVAARADSMVYRLGRFLRRNRIGVGVAVLVVASIALQTVFYTRQIQQERDGALAERQTAESVSEFLVDMFKVANPNEGYGTEMTAREILDVGVEKIRANLDDNPVVKARLLRTMAIAYLQLASFDKAEELIRQAVSINEAHLEATDEQLLISLEVLSSVLRKKERWDEARTVAQRVLEIREALVGSSDPSLHQPLATLGVINFYLDEFDESLANFERIIAIERKALPENDPARAKAFNHAALTHERMGRYSEAEAAYRKSLQLRENGYGEDSPRTSLAMSNLGIFLSNQARYDEAEPYIAAALEIERKAYGEDNTNLTYSLRALASIEENRGNLAFAASYLEQIKALWHNTSTTHSNYANAMRSLGRMYGLMGRFDEALDEGMAGYELFREIHGESHSMVAQSLHTISETYQRKGDYQTAFEFQERALAMRRQVLEPGHIELRNSLEVFAKINLRMGDPARAKRNIDEALSMSEEHQIKARIDEVRALADDINRALSAP